MMYGIAEGMILDNATRFGGLDSDTQLDWMETVKLYTSNVTSKSLDDAITEYMGIAGSNAQNRVLGLYIDTSKMELTDKLGEAFATATSKLGEIADDYTPITSPGFRPMGRGRSGCDDNQSRECWKRQRKQQRPLRHHWDSPQ
jgi:hypothetical protein